MRIQSNHYRRRRREPWLTPTGEAVLCIVGVVGWGLLCWWVLGGHL